MDILIMLIQFACVYILIGAIFSAVMIKLSTIGDHDGDKYMELDEFMTDPANCAALFLYIAAFWPYYMFGFMAKFITKVFKLIMNRRGGDANG